MKRALALITAAGILAGNVFADPIIVKQRALELRNQNNVRQGVTPSPQPGQPTQPVAPSVPAASTAPTTLLQQSLARVKADLAAIQANSPVTSTQKQQLAKDLLASAQGASKPSPATVAALADSLAAAFVQKPLSEASRNRLVSDLAAVLNPARIQAAQMQAIYDDIQAIFQANGMARKDAVKIVDQVKAVGAETQR
jgi:hypothetical protein